MAAGAVVVGAGPGGAMSARSPMALGSRRLVAPLALLVGLLALWLIWRPPSPDLAAQVYRLRLFSADGFSLWDNSWYGGHYVPDYSLILPALAYEIGLRATGVAAATLSTLIFWRLAARHEGFAAPGATAVFALGAVGDLFIGWIAFALGVTFGMGSVLAIVRGRRLWSGACSLGCAATSPVAAAFPIFVACADLTCNRVWRRAVVVAGPALALTLAMLALFPEGGYEPFGLLSLVAAAVRWAGPDRAAPGARAPAAARDGALPDRTRAVLRRAHADGQQRGPAGRPAGAGDPRRRGPVGGCRGAPDSTSAAGGRLCPGADAGPGGHRVCGGRRPRGCWHW